MTGAGGATYREWVAGSTLVHGDPMRSPPGVGGCGSEVFVPHMEPPYVVSHQFVMDERRPAEPADLFAAAKRAYEKAAGAPANIIEVSSAGEDPGRRLSAMWLREGGVPVECVYQAAKVFQHSGKHPEWEQERPGVAKRKARSLSYREWLRGVEIGGVLLGTETGSAAYDWLYARAAWGEANRALTTDVMERAAAFHDVFHPAGSLNACQARTMAMIAGMEARDVLETALESPAAWMAAVTGAARSCAGGWTARRRGRG